MIERIERFVAALGERRVFRWVVAYAAVSWGLVEATGFTIDNYALPRRTLDVVLFLIAVFFPTTLVLVWYHGQKGRQRVGRVEATLLLALAAVAIGGSFSIATRPQTTPAPQAYGVAEVEDLGEGSVAVLPFRNSVADPAFEWLGRGLADLLSTHLAQLENLRVVSGQRLFDLMRQEGWGNEPRVPTGHESRIARRAGARHLVTGSVFGTPGDLAITVTLQDARTGEISASSSARGQDVFGLVDRVSAQLSSQIAGRPIAPSELTSVSRMTTTSFEAYREFQLGRQAHERYDYREAVEHFRRAVALDSSFALAHFRLAGALYSLNDVSAAVTHAELARAKLTTASERDRLFIEGFSEFGAGNRERAAALLRELVGKYPDEKEARAMFGLALAQWRGADDPEARRLLEEVLRLDPTYGNAYNLLAYSYAGSGDFEAADSLSRQYAELEPEEPNPLDTWGEILEYAGRHREAREQYRGALERRGNFTPSLMHLGRSYLTEGRTEEARAEMAVYVASEIPEVRVESRIQQGDAWLHEGAVERARERYGEALEEALSAGLTGAALMPLYKLIGLSAYTQEFERVPPLTSLLREVQPLADYWVAIGFDSLAARGDVDGMEAWKAEVEAEYRADPRLAGRLESLSLVMETWIASARGDHERVLELSRLRNRLHGLGLTHYVPELVALMALGRPAEILELVDQYQDPNLLLRPFRFAPIRHRLMQYWEGRAYESLGDTARARGAYGSLVEEFGEAVKRFPMIADAPERLAWLSPEPNPPKRPESTQ